MAHECIQAAIQLLPHLVNRGGILGNGGKPLPDDVAAAAAEETAEANPT